MIFNFTERNHFKVSYDEVPFVLRSNPQQKFSTSHGLISRTLGSWREECFSVAQKLWDKHGENLVVFLSGGMDSEVMLRSFLGLGLRPRVTIIRFENFLNHHDIHFAIELCADFQITPQYIDVNVEGFWRDEVFNYTDPVQTISPQLGLLFWATDQVDGVPVIGAGENYLRREENTNIFFDVESEVICGLYRWFIHRNREAVPCFFQYTPEIMYSFLCDPILEEFLKEAKTRRLLSTEKVKYELYRRHFDLKPRAALTGYERCQDIDEVARSTMRQKYIGADIIQTIPFQEYLKGFE